MLHNHANIMIKTVAKALAQKPDTATLTGQKRIYNEHTDLLFIYYHQTEIFTRDPV